MCKVCVSYEDSVWKTLWNTYHFYTHLVSGYLNTLLSHINTLTTPTAHPQTTMYFSYPLYRALYTVSTPPTTTTNLNIIGEKK